MTETRYCPECNRRVSHGHTCDAYRTGYADGRAEAGEGDGPWQRTVGDSDYERGWHDGYLAGPGHGWRTGRKVGRTVYAMVGSIPSDDDVLIGVFDTPELAALAVMGHNYRQRGLGAK